MEGGIHGGRVGRDGAEEGLRLVISRGGMKGRSKGWVLNRVGEGLRVPVGLRV